MKKLLLLLILCIPAMATPAFVQAGQCQSGGLSCTVTLTITAGNTIFCMGGGSIQPTSITCTDSKSQTYTAVNSLHYYAGIGGNERVSAATAVKFGAAAGSTIVTCTTTDSTNYQGCTVFELSGVDTVDQVAVADTAGTGASGSASSGTTSSTTANDEIAVSYYVSENSVTSWTADSGWTIPSGGSQVGSFGSAAAYKILTSTGAQSHTITMGVQRATIGMMATFRMSGGAARRRQPITQ